MYKMEDLGSAPSLTMGAFRAAPHEEKTGDFGAKNNTDLKRIFFKTRVFSICPGRKSGTKNCIFLKRGSFGAA